MIIITYNGIIENLLVGVRNRFEIIFQRIAAVPVNRHLTIEGLTMTEASTVKMWVEHANKKRGFGIKWCAVQWPEAVSDEHMLICHMLVYPHSPGLYGEDTSGEATKEELPF